MFPERMDRVLPRAHTGPGRHGAAMLRMDRRDDEKREFAELGNSRFER